ncbi:MAG: glycosyltransferase [Verrucomicrobia bacterium]|nr:glycosyltransferase [Verrucomicrobiota bacterium]
MRPPQLSIVLPCLNEALTLSKCIVQARQALEDAHLSGEIIVADNGSTDGSREIALAHGARVIPVEQRGYGYALQAGISAARAPYVLMGDADCSYDFGHAGRFVALLDEGYDLVMGNRFKGGIKPRAMPWKNRYIGNPLLTTIGRILFSCPVGDFHCGLRAFRKEAFDRMDLRTGGMEFASEMVIRATLLNLRIGEIPTTLSPDGRNRPPHLRPWRDGWRHLRFMLLFSPRWLFLHPGFALMAAGTVLGGLILPGPVALGRLTLDVHTLLFCAIAVLIGFQSVQFAILTKVFAIRSGLRPREPAFERAMRWITLEAGLILGALMVSAGLGLSLGAVLQWNAHQFGPLSPAETLRWVIPGGLLLALGCQTVLGSCFLGILGLKLSK